MITASLGSAAVRIALAIVLDTGALVIWDVGTRSPVRLTRDVCAGLAEKRAVIRGLTRLVLGACALLAAAMVSAPAASRPVDFTVIECWALVTALALEQLVGPDLRSGRRWRSGRTGTPDPR